MRSASTSQHTLNLSFTIRIPGKIKLEDNASLTGEGVTQLADGASGPGSRIGVLLSLSLPSLSEKAERPLLKRSETRTDMHYAALRTARPGLSLEAARAVSTKIPEDGAV